MVGQYKLHDKCYCAAAGNRMEDKAGATGRMSTALQSRLVHLNIGIDKDGWLRWAIANGFRDRITAFVEFMPEYLNKFDPNHTDDTFACQRTLHFLHNVTNHMDHIPNSKLALLAGCVGQGCARDFLNFVNFYQNLPKYEAIVQDPLGIAIPSEAGVKYALVGMMSSNVTADTLDAALQFVDRLSSDFKLVFIRQSYMRNKLLVSNPAFMARIREIRSIIVD